VKISSLRIYVEIFDKKGNFLLRAQEGNELLKNCLEQKAHCK